MSYDSEANAAYLAIEPDVPGGSAAENVVVERPGRGDIVLDFGSDGRLLGVEVIGARELLSADVLQSRQMRSEPTRSAARTDVPLGNPPVVIHVQAP